MKCSRLRAMPRRVPVAPNPTPNDHRSACLLHTKDLALSKKLSGNLGANIRNPEQKYQ